MKAPFLVTVSTVALLLATATTASAHANVDHCTPSVGSAIGVAPSQIVCVMTEEIDTKQSTMSVVDSSGVPVDKKDAHVDLNDPDHKTLLVSLDPAAMKDGVYTVKWHAVTTDDNAVTDGTFQFIVGSASATIAPTTFAEQGVGTPAAATPEATSVASVESPTSMPPPSVVTAPTVAPTASPAPTSAAAPTTAPTTGGSIPVFPVLVTVALLLALALIAGGVAFHRRA